MMHSIYGAGNDGCEWDPDENKAARGDSEHYQTAQATVLVGADGRWRLCQSCSELPEFKMFRVRRSIEEIRRDRAVKP